MRARVRHISPGSLGFQVAMDARFLTGADNSAVSAWASRSSGLYGATAAGTAQPTLKTRSINGNNAVQFDGTTDVMAFEAGARAMLNGASGATAIAVVVVDNTGADATQVVFLFSSGSGAAPVRFSMRAFEASTPGASSLGRRLDADSAVQTSRAAGLTSSPCIAQSNADWAGNALTTRTNGGAQTSIGYSSGAGNVSATNSVAGNLGAQDAATNRLSGRIGAIAIATPLISQPVRMRLRQAFGFSFKIATA